MLSAKGDKTSYNLGFEFFFIGLIPDWYYSKFNLSFISVWLSMLSSNFLTYVAALDYIFGAWLKSFYSSSNTWVILFFYSTVVDSSFW